MSFREDLAARAAIIGAALQAHLSEFGGDQIADGMRYATNGGKRLRGFLVLASAELFEAPRDGHLIAAAAIECLHAYSLVHDDLPAMDDDYLRRGKPTCHKAFDEATAILAGDALQCLAFEVLTDDPAMKATAEQRLAMVAELAHASGSRGMAGGQAIDIAAEGSLLALEQLQTMHRYKTGALIRAAVRLGALSAAEIRETQRAGLDRYAEAVGLAFQIRDDILDVVADTETLGKPQGSDQDREKPTYTSLLGLDGAREKALALHQEALEGLADFGSEAEPLRLLSAYIVERAN